jgi:hypothetical protein
LQRDDRRYWLLLGGLTLVYLLPIWAFRFLPFVDLPQHLGFATILRNYNNPATDYRQVFELKLWPAHNVLHLFICYLLSFVTSVETANRLFLSLYVIGFPLALHHLLKTLGGSRWLNLAGFLFVYNFNLFWGFPGAAFDIPLVILVLSLTLRYVASPFPLHRVERGQGVRSSRPGLLLLVGLLAVVTFLGHALLYLFMLALLNVVLLAYTAGQPTTAPAREKWRPFWFVNLSLAPASIFFAGPWQASVFSQEGDNVLTLLFSVLTPASMASRFNEFFSSVYQRGDEISLFMAKLLVVVAVTATIISLVRRRVGTSPLGDTTRSGIPGGFFSGRDQTVNWLIVFSLGCYLFLPAETRTTSTLNGRFVVFVFLFLVARLALFTAEWKLNSRRISVLLAATVLLNAVNLGYRFAAFNREVAPAAAMLRKLPKDKKVLGLMYESRTKPDLLGYDVLLHFANYYQVWNRGYSGFSLAAFHYFPIHYRGENRFLQTGQEWAPWEFVFPDGWQFYDYYLVHGRVIHPGHDYISRGPLVGQAGEWSLYQRPDDVGDTTRSGVPIRR